MFPPEKPSAQFPYRVESKVGEGAMGEVYKATETSLGRPVAIKILKPSFLDSLDASRAREATQRFLQEARAAARLSHPGVTTIYRVGVESHTPFIAMEWLEGEDLEKMMRRGQVLTVPEVVALGVELSETLAAAHRAGVIHRDVKPGNIIRLRDGHIKVADFGVARVTDSDLVQTQAGAILGTPLYSAPEQLHGHSIDGRADVYSVGAVLYELLTRRTPYQASSLISLLQQVISTSTPEPPQNLNHQVSRELGAVIMSALSRSPDGRPADGDALAHALRPFLQTVDVRAATAALASTPLPAQVLAPVTVLPGSTPTELVSNLARHWPGKPLGQQSADALIERLLERPLHAEPFAGVAHIGDAFFLIHGGLVYGILDPKRGLHGDIVEEMLPHDVPATLHPVPDALDDRIIPLLASTLLPPDYVHDSLDVSFVDLAQLTAKLSKEGFDGVVRFAQGPQQAYLFISRGRPVLHLFSRGWSPDPSSQPWTTWIASSGATASVERRVTNLSAHSYRRALRDFSFTVKSRDLDLDVRSSTGSSAPLAVSLSLEPERAVPDQGDATLNQIYTSDPLYGFLDWLGRDLPSFFAERDRIKRWRYLAEWVPLVRRAVLHHDLPRPKSQESDTFDLVTFDESGKALHLAHRHAHGSADALESFVERVIAAKTARIKTGDVGGACFIAPSFDDDALALYDTMTVHEEKRSFLFSLQDSLTRYEGFVRMGSRRGFHLLLVVETPEGFRPLLPKGV